MKLYKIFLADSNEEERGRVSAESAFMAVQRYAKDAMLPASRYRAEEVSK